MEPQNITEKLKSYAEILDEKIAISRKIFEQLPVPADAENSARAYSYFERKVQQERVCETYEDARAEFYKIFAELKPKAEEKR